VLVIPATGARKVDSGAGPSPKVPLTLIKSARWSKCDCIESLWQAHDDVVLQSNQDALRDLQWVYLKVRLARQHVIGSDTEGDDQPLRAAIETLERELGDPKL
jgi:hypothetical protein